MDETLKTQASQGKLENTFKVSFYIKGSASAVEDIEAVLRMIEDDLEG